MYVRLIYSVYQNSQVCASVEEAKAIIKRQWPDAAFGAVNIMLPFRFSGCYTCLSEPKAVAIILWVEKDEIPVALPKTEAIGTEATIRKAPAAPVPTPSPPPLPLMPRNVANCNHCAGVVVISLAEHCVRNDLVFCSDDCADDYHSPDNPEPFPIDLWPLDGPANPSQ